MAIAYVNGSAVHDGGVGSGTTYQTAAFVATAGNNIIVCTTNYTTGGVAVSSVTDTAGNSYTLKGSTGSVDANHVMNVWVSENITGNASNVVTVTWASSAQFRGIMAEQYSGLATSSSYDSQSSFAADGSSVTTHTTPSVTTANANDLLLGFAVSVTAGGAYSSSGTSTVRDSVSGQLAAFDRIVSSTGNYTTQVDTASGSNQFTVTTAFKGASGYVPRLALMGVG